MINNKYCKFVKQSFNFKLYSKLCLFNYKKCLFYLFVKKLFKFFFEFNKILYFKKIFI